MEPEKIIALYRSQSWPSRAALARAANTTTYYVDTAFLHARITPRWVREPTKLIRISVPMADVKRLQKRAKVAKKPLAVYCRDILTSA